MAIWDGLCYTMAIIRKKQLEHKIFTHTIAV